MAGEGSQEQDGGLGDRLRQALGAITLDDTAKPVQRPKQSYAFWGTQPVAQFNEQPGALVRGGCLLLTGNAAAASAALPPPPPLCRHRRRLQTRLAACLDRLQAAADGPIDEPKTVDDVRKEPYGLPKE